MSQTHPLTHNVTLSLVLSNKSSLFVDRFGRYLRFYDLEFDRAPFMMVRGVKLPVSVGGLSDFRDFLAELLWMLSSCS